MPKTIVPDLEQRERDMRAYFQAAVYNHLDLQAEWQGWRMRGRDLVSPCGKRINPRRLLGILYQEESRQRLLKLQGSRKASSSSSSAQVLQLPARERFDGAA